MAQFGAPYGILGWIHVFSFTEKNYNIFNYLPWFIKIKKEKNIIHVSNWKKKQKHFIIKIKNIESRSIVQKLTNHYINIERNSLPKLKANNYYWRDIINCNAINESNEFLGTVSNIIRTSSNDILVIKRQQTNKKKDILIPFVLKNIIKKVNIEKKTIIVNWDDTLEQKY
ncbi:MAG: ribosome maturation factor RimM [Buchnera aphidicola (Nurudea shiraii)]